MGSRYIVFDTETPNSRNNRMSAIGISVVEDGVITREFATLVNPEAHFDPFNIQLTGITPEAVEAAPTFPALWQELEPLFDSGMLVAHNAPFDMVMSVKVAINGFGRIGRLAFRQMFGAEGYEVVAINDLTDPAMLANLLKYDTAQGGYCGKIGENLHTVEAGEGSIIVDGKEITIYAKPNAAELPWGELGVDVVLECTGFYTSKAKSQAHIDAGAKKVVISAPAGNDLKTIVYSVNEKTLTADDTIISAASCTTNCLAPMADTLNKYAEIQSGIMSTIHAYTGDQMILDGPHRKGDKRRARAGAANIVPNSTGAAKAIGLVIPELNGKLIGSAQRVPVPTGSTTILTAVVKGSDVTVEGINAAMKAAASESFGYNEDPIVSSDVIGMRFGSLFDATQTMVSKIADDLYEVQVVSWYDNENSYTSQMVRTIKYFAELG